MRSKNLSLAEIIILLSATKNLQTTTLDSELDYDRCISIVSVVFANDSRRIIDIWKKNSTHGDSFWTLFVFLLKIVFARSLKEKNK